MADLHCPNCNVELMGHEAGKCFDQWVKTVFFDADYPIDSFSIHLPAAWHLMQKVWEIDPWATIHRDKIEVEGEHKDRDNMDCVKDITGATFPLRVARAALYLALKPGAKIRAKT